MNTNLSEIAFEELHGNYHWGRYGDFRVIVDISTGYINATHLCSLATSKQGNPKQFRVWLLLDYAKDLIELVAASVGIPTDRIVIKPKVGNDIRGSYVHPKLVPHVASWASPVFALKVSEIVNAHIVREYKESIRVKDTTIDELKRTVEEIKRQNEEQTNQINQLLYETKATREENAIMIGQLDVITGELEDTSMVNEELHQKVDLIAEKLDIATDQRVPPARPSQCDEVFAMYRNPDTNTFYMIRRQKRTIMTAIRNCSKNGFTERFYWSDSPNAVNLGVRIKSVIPKWLAVFTGVIIRLAPGRTAAELLDYIREAEMEKKEI